MQLRFRHLGTLCVLALTLANSTLRAQDEEKTPLAKKMSAINTAFKAIGQIDDPSKNASTLEQLAIIETNAKAAMAMEPEKKGKIPAAEQAKFMSDYQAGMKHFAATLAQLRTTLKAGKNAEAAVLVDSLKSLQRDSHKEFRIKKAGAPPSF
jgi:soluble cytochrome b562